MSEYATIEHYVNHVIDEINRRDVEQISERLRAFGWEEVVHCRDCKHKYGCVHLIEIIQEDGDGDMIRCKATPDGFCKWGVRE